MQRTILRFGLISGCIAAILLFGVTLFTKMIGYEKSFDYSAYLGYGAILISMSLVYFGIRSFRDQEGAGTLTFSKGLLIGLGIMVVSCIFYSLAWLVIYYNFIPNFIEDYSQYASNKAQQAGAGPAELAKITSQMDQLKAWYKNPFSIFAITLTEPMPVGLLVTLVSAFILKRK
jgi:hypothetical protein